MNADDLQAFLARRDAAGHEVLGVELDAADRVGLVLRDVDGASAAEVLRQARLVYTDLRMARVIEDILDVLTAKGVMAESDLPPDARARLAERRDLRTAAAASKES
jgi:hypothetical protein